MGRPPSSTDLSLTRITDVHIHVQPWRELKPNVLDMMWRGQNAHRDLMIQVMDDPRALLEVMDRSGVWRAGLVNYPSPDVKRGCTPPYGTSRSGSACAYLAANALLAS